MSLFLILAFLFFIGSLAGWCLELVYRRFFSAVNPDRHWINPGFCTGPYLPLYGSGLCILYLLASLDHLLPWLTKPLLFILMAISMTGIEFVAGIWSLKRNKVRLWDYTSEWGNIEGVICPKFSFYWAVLGALYYFLIHPYILASLMWLSNNLAFSFVIGMFFGVFTIDFAHSAQLVAKLKVFAEENEVIIRYEAVKSHIRSHHEQTKEKYRFFRPFHSELPLRDHLKNMAELKHKIELRKLQELHSRGSSGTD